MGSDNLPVEVLKSKAGEKRAEAVKDAVGLGHNIVDYLAGGKRMREVAEARADAAVIKASADIKIDTLRAQAAERLLARELRNQRNIDAITKEAFKALPPSDANVSDTPVSEDFIYRFFEECQGVGNEQMQKLWGALLAGEVVRPGSFHPHTLRTLKDMELEDAEAFETVCCFSWRIGQECVQAPLLFEINEPFYRDSGLTFGLCKHLEALGVVSVEMVGSYAVELTGVECDLLFADYVANYWRRQGHTVTLVAPPAAQAP